MRSSKTTRLLAAVLALLALQWAPRLVVAAGAQALPPRDLTIELRQIDEAKAQGLDTTAVTGKSFSAGAAPSPGWEPQMVQVRNGQKVSLRMQSATPMQWVQSAQQRSGGNAAAPGAVLGKGQSGTTAKAAVQNALTWFDAGQSITVHPTWSGGNSAVVELEVQKAGFEERTGADLPTQNRNTVSTTVTAPLAQWVTIAATGRTPQAASYSSESAQRARRLLQIRVMVP